ncbi:hypothetical protein [Sphingomonas sp. Leaf10]|uniref:hypothetical protein n=1 Tax=Sphingomonas sp. Leaf10 TaxID=1735676 RepID=UPI000AC0B258|nr:hypothetical protein [Sphingomonas sp. Leaf10]
MTDDLVGRLRKGRLIQANQTRTMTCGTTGFPIEVGTGEIRELPHPDALEAAARIEALEAALRPFAEAADDLDDKHRDSSPIWEAPAALGIDAGHLRDAQKLLAKGPPHAD